MASPKVKPEDRKKTGRPTTYTPELGEQICQWMIEGQSLSEICRRDTTPGISTIYQWAEAQPEFAEALNRARLLQAETWAGQSMDIADNATNDWMERQRPDGTIDTVVNHEHVNRSRLRIQARQWVAEKILPRYAARQVVAHTGPDGGPVQIEQRNAILVKLWSLLEQRMGVAQPVVIEHEEKKP